MRKESSTLQKCKRQMATLGFDSQLAYHRVKLILKIYRDVVWVLSERVEELHEYAWELGAQDADTGLIYLQSFAPDMDLQEFEERVCCVMENRMLVDVIDRALLRLKRYPDRGELYYEILTKQFIHRFNSREKELLDELNMERSVFYDLETYYQGIVYICETLSDIIQVGYFKLTHGKRIFKMAPLHHHFEMCGWKETKVVTVFTAVSVIGCVIAYLAVCQRFSF